MNNMKNCEFALEIANLNKRYCSSGFELKSVSLKHPKGTIMGLIGENGSGKSTTLSSVLGLLRPDSGCIEIFGKDIETNDIEIKEDIGVVLGEDCFPTELTSRNIETVMRGIYRKWDTTTFKHCLNAFDIQYDKKIREFSSGMKRKLSLAVALSHDPRLLILDEVTSGLDPVSREAVLDELMEFMQNPDSSILITSHITTDLEKIADYVAFIDEGKILLVEEKDKLLYEYGIVRIELEQANSISNDEMFAWVKDGMHISALIENKKRFETEHPDIIVNKPSLEEVAIIIIKGEKHDGVNSRTNDKKVF